MFQPGAIHVKMSKWLSQWESKSESVSKPRRMRGLYQTHDRRNHIIKD